jgi:hypothetical protein
LLQPADACLSVCSHIQILSNAGFWFCITVVPLLACLPDFTAQ